MLAAAHVELYWIAFRKVVTSSLFPDPTPYFPAPYGSLPTHRPKLYCFAIWRYSSLLLKSPFGRLS